MKKKQKTVPEAIAPHKIFSYAASTGPVARTKHNVVHAPHAETQLWRQAHAHIEAFGDATPKTIKVTGPDIPSKFKVFLRRDVRQEAEEICAILRRPSPPSANGQTSARA